jgi:hypothetical protein
VTTGASRRSMLAGAAHSWAPCDRAGPSVTGRSRRKNADIRSITRASTNSGRGITQRVARSAGPDHGATGSHHRCTFPVRPRATNLPGTRASVNDLGNEPGSDRWTGVSTLRTGLPGTRAPVGRSRRAGRSGPRATTLTRVRSSLVGAAPPTGVRSPPAPPGRIGRGTPGKEWRSLGYEGIGAVIRAIIPGSELSRQARRPCIRSLSARSA